MYPTYVEFTQNVVSNMENYYKLHLEEALKRHNKSGIY